MEPNLTLALSCKYYILSWFYSSLLICTEAKYW